MEYRFLTVRELLLKGMNINMRILFLGTGAADWEKNPQNFDGVRKFSSALVNEMLLIDPAPTSYRYFVFLGGDATKITDVILTHSHADHLDIDDLRAFAKASGKKLRFWCDEKVYKKLEALKDEVEIHEMPMFEKIQVGDFTVTSVPANHLVDDTDETARHYVIEKGGKTLFYGCDGGWLVTKTWEYIRNLHFDCAVFDCTCGDYEDDWRLGSHNSIPMLRMIVKTMRTHGILKDTSKAVASHLAKTLHTGIKETENLLKRDDIIAAHDGLELEF